MNAVWVGRMTYEWPFYIATTYPVQTPADLKGHKVATSPTTEPSAEALGLIPIETEEEYTALERGVIDTIYTPPISMFADGIFEVATHFISHPLAQGSLVLFCNLDRFNSLPPNLQKALLQGHINARPKMKGVMEGMVGKGISEAEAAGLTMVKFSDDDFKRAEAAVLEAGWEAAKEIVEPESFAKMRQLSGP